MSAEPSRPPRLPILVLDFDGVVHAYSKGWQDGSIYDPPVPGTGEALLKFLGYFQVSIFSTRSRRWLQRRKMRRYVGKIVEDACFANAKLAEKAWSAQRRRPMDWIPWTAGDTAEQAREIAAAIRYPWFKPPAWVTIDDRAVTFQGDWSAFEPSAIWAFRPWMQVQSEKNST